jgi:hypothetical protein
VFGKTEVATTTGLVNDVGMIEDCPENGFVGTVEMLTISWFGTDDGTSVYGIKTPVVDGKTKTQCDAGANDPGITTAEVGITLEAGSYQVSTVENGL